jgi:nucleoid-associated protein YgaU
MKKLMGYSLLLGTFLFLNGCVIRTATYEVDRVDQEIAGNRGFVVGGQDTQAAESQEISSKKRTMYNVEVELPSLHRNYIAGVNDHDKVLYGNRGYVNGQAPKSEDTTKTEYTSTTTFRKEPRGFGSRPQVVYSEPVKSDYEEATLDTVEKSGSYIVKKGDTLQKISNKMFGTTKKWKKIYESNRSVLKSPDRIRAGQKIVIPQE